MYKRAVFIFIVLFLFGNSAEGDKVSDFNGDGVVDIADFLLFTASFGSNHGDEKYNARYDLNSDGSIEIGDFLSFVENFGKEVPDQWENAKSQITGFTYDAQSGIFYVVTWHPFNRVFAFSTSKFLRLRHLDFYLDIENGGPQGIAAGGGKIFVGNDSGNLLGGTDEVFVYTTTGQRAASLDFSLPRHHIGLSSLCYADGKLYITNNSPRRILTYSVNQKKVLHSFEPNIWAAGTPDWPGNIARVGDLLFVTGRYDLVHVLDTLGDYKGRLFFPLPQDEQGYYLSGAGIPYVNGQFYKVYSDGSFRGYEVDISGF